VANIQQHRQANTLRYNGHASRQTVTQQSDIHQLPQHDRSVLTGTLLYLPSADVQPSLASLYHTTWTLIYQVKCNACCQPKENNTLSYNERSRTHGQSE